MKKLKLWDIRERWLLCFANAPVHPTVDFLITEIASLADELDALRCEVRALKEQTAMPKCEDGQAGNH